MNAAKTRNDMSSAVPRFCHGLETHRRTPDGRLRSAVAFLQHFFPHNEKAATDRVFRFLPHEVRGPILTAWGLRGKKSALRDTDEKVLDVVQDALLSGDLDATAFEDALGADTVIPWVDLSDWWSFWRTGPLPKHSILKALELGYELLLFDAESFLESLRVPDGMLRRTDVLAQGLSKAELTGWVRTIYQLGNGSAKGILSALGWDQIVGKTADGALLGALDAMAARVGLVLAEGAATGDLYIGDVASGPRVPPVESGVAPVAPTSASHAVPPPADDRTLDEVAAALTSPAPPTPPAQRKKR